MKTDVDIERTGSSFLLSGGALTWVMGGLLAAVPEAMQSSESKPPGLGLVVTNVWVCPRPARWVRFEGWITPSEDCRHVAYRAKSTTGKWSIVRDGVSGNEYDEAHSQMFSPDSAHLAYLAKREGKCFVVLDGVEGNPFSSIGPTTKGSWPFAFSPDGGHLGYVASIESGKQCVVVDGRQGPVFDEVFLHSFKFSENSQHFAYAARRGGKAVVVKDAKEVLEAEDILSNVHSFGSHQIGDTYGLFISPDGTRVASMVRRGTNWFAVVDGVESRPWDAIVYSAQPGETGFSPDGRYFTYAAHREGKFYVMLDEHDMAQCDYGGYVVFSPDSKRNAFVRSERKQGQGLVSSVVLDGVSGKAFDAEVQELVFSPNGKRLAYTVGSWMGDRDGEWVVVVQGESELRGMRPRGHIVFSPDGAHMAFCGVRDRKSFVVLDGKELPKSEDSGSDVHNDVIFSPDSNRWAYIGLRDHKHYAVVSGREYGPYDYLSEPLAREAYIYFSPDSRHFAFIATRIRGPKDYLGQQFLAVDGVEHEIQGEWLSKSLLRFDSATKLHGLVMGKDRIERVEVELVEK